MGLSNYDPTQDLSATALGGLMGSFFSSIVDAQSQAALSTVSFIKSVWFTPDTEDETTGTVIPGSPVYVSFTYPKMLAPYVPGINGRVKTATVAGAGSLYVTGDILTLGAGGASVKVTAAPIVPPTTAVGTATGGAITSVTLESPGRGYKGGTETAGGGSGTGATITITVEDVDPTPAVFEEMIMQVPMATLAQPAVLRIDNAEFEFNAKITSMEYRNAATELKTSTGIAVTNENVSTFGLHAGKFLSIDNKNTSSVQLNVNASAQSSTKEGFKIEKTFQLAVKVKASQDELPAGMDKVLGILEDAIVSQPAKVSA